MQTYSLAKIKCLAASPSTPQAFPGFVDFRLAAISQFLIILHLPMGKHGFVYAIFVHQGTHIWNMILEKLNINLLIHIFKRNQKV